MRRSAFLLIVMSAAMSCTGPRDRVALFHTCAPVVRSNGLDGLGRMLMVRWAAYLVGQEACLLDEEQLLALPGRVFQVGADFPCGERPTGGATPTYFVAGFAEADRDEAVRVTRGSREEWDVFCRSFKEGLGDLKKRQDREIDEVAFYLSHGSPAEGTLVKLVLSTVESETQDGTIEVKCVSSSLVDHGKIRFTEES